MTEPRYTTIQGQRALVLPRESGLPQKLPDLLTAMEHFGYAFRDDFVARGTRTSCEQLNEHRLRTWREGRWWNPRPFMVHVNPGATVRRVAAGVEMSGGRRVEAGLLLIRLERCQDCDAVCVRDVSVEMNAGGRPARLRNLKTGAERIAPAIGRRNVVLGWYSGKRRGGREYK